MRKFAAAVLIATLFGCSDSSGPKAGPPATLLVLAGGTLQAGVFGQPVPIAPTVLVIDADNQPVPDVNVTFAAAPGNGTVTSPTRTTDSKGAASANWVLGNTFGTKTLTVSVQGLPPVTFSANAIAPDVGILAFTLADPVGDTLSNSTAFPPTAPDLVSLRGDFKRDSLIVVATFNAPISPGSLSPNSIGGYLEIDIDDNQNTGFDVIANDFGGTAALGIEYELEFFDFDGSNLLLYNADSVAAVRASFSGNSVTVRIPMNRLSSDDGNFSIAGVIGTPLRATDIFPNSGQGVVRRGSVSTGPLITAQRSPLIGAALKSLPWRDVSRARTLRGFNRGP